MLLCSHSILIRVLFGLAIFAGLPGCGKTLRQNGTEQLITSHAVDRAVSQIDFTPLGGHKVYLDDQYMKNVKGTGFVNADYITSALRQQMVAARCYLVDKKEDSDFVVEGRIGALGSDQHELTYGIPANKALTDAASIVPTAPSIPSIPNISFARKDQQSAAAKISLFAYHRESLEPAWQSGIQQARSDAKETYIFNAGPFQSGEVFDEPQLAGSRFPLLEWMGLKKKPKQRKQGGDVPYFEEFVFDSTVEPTAAELQLAGHEEVQNESEGEKSTDGKPIVVPKLLPENPESPASGKQIAPPAVQPKKK